MVFEFFESNDNDGIRGHNTDVGLIAKYHASAGQVGDKKLSENTCEIFEIEENIIRVQKWVHRKNGKILR